MPRAATNFRVKVLEVLDEAWVKALKIGGDPRTNSGGTRITGTEIGVGSFGNNGGEGNLLSSAATASVRFYGDDGGAALTAGNLRNVLSRVNLTTDAILGTSIRSITGQLKLQAGVDITSVNSVVAGIFGYLELAGDSTLNGQVAAGEFTVEGAGDITIGANGFVAGVASRLNMASGKTIDVESAAFTAMITGGAADAWKYGYHVADGAADTGLYIGDCTDNGIDFAGDTTAAIVASGTFERFINIQTYTPGTTTDGAFINLGNNIGAPMTYVAAGTRVITIYAENTATSGEMLGMRLRCATNAASGTPNLTSMLGQASITISTNAGVVNAGMFEVIPKGDQSIATIRGLLVNIDSAATQVVGTQQTVGHFRVHTRGDETMSGTDEMLRLENEAVGGNGRQLDSFIRFMDFNLSGGIKAAGYMLDGGVDTDLLATGFLRLPDDGTVADASDPGDGNPTLNSDFTGFIKIMIGTSTRYIPISTNKPSGF